MGSFRGLSSQLSQESGLNSHLECFQERRSLDSFDWYSALYEYSRPAKPAAVRSDDMDVDKDESSDDDNEEPPLGPDGDLVNSMVTTAVIPRLARVLSGGGFDPYSEKQTRRLVDLAEQVEMCVDKTDFKFQVRIFVCTTLFSLYSSFSTIQTFIKAAIHPFRDAIDSTHDLVIRATDPNNPPPSFEPQSFSARRRFLLRRLKLLSNLMIWRKFIGESFGLGALVEKIVKDIMEPIARNGGDDGGGKEIMLKVRIQSPRVDGRSDDEAMLGEAIIKDLAQEPWARSL